MRPSRSFPTLLLESSTRRLHHMAPRPVTIALQSPRSRTPWWLRCARYFRPEVNMALGALLAVGVVGAALSFVSLTHRVHALEQALCRERLVVAQRTQPLLQSLTLPADPCAAVEQWLAMTGRPASPVAPGPVVAPPPALPSSRVALAGTSPARPASETAPRLVPALFRRSPAEPR
jgi:hypothetical protein